MQKNNDLWPNKWILLNSDFYKEPKVMIKVKRNIKCKDNSAFMQTHFSG